jgi:hypothetical protein
MGDDEYDPTQQIVDGVIVNGVASDHLIGNAGNFRDLGRDRKAGIFEPLPGTENFVDPPVLTLIFEEADAEFDNPIAIGVGAGGFHIHNGGDEFQAGQQREYKAAVVERYRRDFRLCVLRLYRRFDRTAADGGILQHRNLGPRSNPVLSRQHDGTIPVFAPNLRVLRAGRFFRPRRLYSRAIPYIPELFPTRVRATAVSFCNGGARVITSFGPLVAGLLAAPFGGNFNKPAALMTCFALVSIYAMYLGRETRADPLPR